MTAAPHAVITGSASGIGLALTRRLLAAGWIVTGIDRHPHPADLRDRVRALTLDLADPARIAAAALPEGPVTAFVHCAGLMRSDQDAEIRDDGGRLLWQLHVGAAEALIRRVVPQLPDGRGRILVMSSRAAAGRAERSLYAASKAAVEGLVRSFAAELVRRGVTANAIAPGSTDTPMLRDPSRANLAVMPLPIGRLIDPDEIAAFAEFLIGPHAGAITGQMIYVCGGASIAGLPAVVPRG